MRRICRMTANFPSRKGGGHKLRVEGTGGGTSFERVWCTGGHWGTDHDRQLLWRTGHAGHVLASRLIPVLQDQHGFCLEVWDEWECRNGFLPGTPVHTAASDMALSLRGTRPSVPSAWSPYSPAPISNTNSRQLLMLLMPDNSALLALVSSHREQ